MSAPYETKRPPRETAELQARRTAAQAVLIDYRRSEDTPGGPEYPAIFAGRLAAALESVLSLPPAGLSPAQLAIVLEGLDVAAEYRRDRVETCPDCDGRPEGLCGACDWRLGRVDEYDALTRELGGQQ